MSAAVRKLFPPPRRGLRRPEAASYVGVSSTKFDELVEDGRMPAPFRSVKPKKPPAVRPGASRQRHTGRGHGATGNYAVVT